MSESVITKLKEYSGKEYVLLTKRANQSLLTALRFAKSEGYENVYIPQSGGWMTYEPFVKRLKLNLEKMPTENEDILFDKLDIQPKSVILIHSLGGYHKTIDTKKMRGIADKANALFIEDTCGTFGSRPCFGHIVVGSFGNAKPINLSHGGFIATNDKSHYDIFAEKVTSELTVDDVKKLEHKLHSLDKRYQFLFQRRDEILSKLPSQFNPICDENALVIIVPFKTEQERDELVAFCDSQTVEHTECPRYIRHDKPAISIEIKRL